jgi:hypothetical protein
LLETLRNHDRPFGGEGARHCPHPEVYLQFGKHDGSVGHINLECWTTEQGSVLAGWLYELKTIAVSVMFAQAGSWQPSPNTWHPLSGSKRFRIVDFQYNKRAARDGDPKEAAAQPRIRDWSMCIAVSARSLLIVRVWRSASFNVS